MTPLHYTPPMFYSPTRVQHWLCTKPVERGRIEVGLYKTKKATATREQYGATWYAGEGAIILTYATTSMLPMLLLVFLNKLKGYFDPFYTKPKLLGPNG